LKLSEFTADTLRPHIGSPFHLTMSDGQVLDLQLEDVEVLLSKDLTPSKKRDSFGLYFEGPEKVEIEAGSYPAHHDVLGGPFLIYFVPLSRRPNGRLLYEAVFT
jgi:hypothetical protein